MPTVSVVIPAYNAMRYLPETLNSVLAQTYSDFEVLIINDGSTDNIIEWSSKIADSRVKVISQLNQGVSMARNTGITHAKGDYIAFLDADDLWEPTKLEKQVCCLNSNPEIGLVYTWTLLINETGEPTGAKYTSTQEGNVWKQILVADIVCSGSSAMVRRDCFEITGMFDLALSSAADFDMWTRIAACYSFSVIKEFLLLYRQSSNSMSRNRLKMIRDLQISFEKRFQSVPAELLHLKDTAYGCMYRNLAWESMYEGNYKEATEYCQQIILRFPMIRHTRNFTQLRLAIFLTRWLGSRAYRNLKSVKSKLRNYEDKSVTEG